MIDRHGAQTWYSVDCGISSFAAAVTTLCTASIRSRVSVLTTVAQSRLDIKLDATTLSLQAHLSVSHSQVNRAATPRSAQVLQNTKKNLGKPNFKCVQLLYRLGVVSPSAHRGCVKRHGKRVAQAWLGVLSTWAAHIKHGVPIHFNQTV